MLKKITIFLVIMLTILFVFNCSTHIHTIGDGPQTGEIKKERQWYILWGFVPLNDVVTNKMAGKETDYEIKTEMEPVDLVITFFTQIITVNCRTVTVTK